MFAIKRPLIFYQQVKAYQLSALPQPNRPGWHTSKLAPTLHCVMIGDLTRSSGLLMGCWCMEAALPFYPYPHLQI